MNMLAKVHIEISKALCVHSIKSVASLSLRLVVLSSSSNFLYTVLFCRPGFWTPVAACR